MKKKSAAAAILALLCAPLYAGFYSIAGERQKPGEIEAFYSERYFEYDMYNSGYLGGRGYDKKVAAITLDPYSVLKGMDIEIGARWSFARDFSAGARLNYLFQRLGSRDYNGPQNVRLFAQYFGPAANITAGLKLPAGGNIPADDPRFVRRYEMFNACLAAGGSASFGPFFAGIELSGEQAINPRSDFRSTGGALAYAGAVFYEEEEKHRASLKTEFYAEATAYKDYYSASTVAVPQLEALFSNGLKLTFGVEALVHAQSLYRNGSDRLTYVVRAEYSLNGEKRPRANREEGGSEGAAGTIEEKE